MRRRSSQVGLLVSLTLWVCQEKESSLLFIEARRLQDDHLSTIDEYNRNRLWIEESRDSSLTRQDNNPIKNPFQRRSRRPDHYFMPLDKNNPLWSEEHVFTGEQRGPQIVSDATRRRKPPQSSRRRTASSSRNNNNHNINMLVGGSDTIAETEEQRERLFQLRRKVGKVRIDLGEPKPITDTTGGTTARQLLGIPTNTNETMSMTKLRKDDATAEAAQEIMYSSSSLLPRAKYDNYQNQNVEISLSVDPASVLRLSQTGLLGAMGLVSALGATLRLLAPLIVARRALTTVGYICYDYYNGRYLRTTYNRQWQKAHDYDLFSALRALGRGSVQLLSMGVAGRITQFILDRSPCWMPEAACQYWYASVCLAIVLVMARVSELLMTTHCQPLEIQPVETREHASGKRYFTRPWHILQWMRDPDAWITNIAKLNSRDNNQRRRYVPFQPDALLFPSTWPPLHALTLLAMARAIRKSLVQPIESSSVNLLLWRFCTQHVLYEEWYRVFLKEKRVALASVVHGLYFLSLANLIYNVALVDAVSGVLLVPAKLASLVSLWMNIVLYSERVVSNKKKNKGSSPKQQQQGYVGRRQSSTPTNWLVGSMEDSQWTELF